MNFLPKLIFRPMMLFAFTIVNNKNCTNKFFDLVDIFSPDCVLQSIIMPNRIKPYFCSECETTDPSKFRYGRKSLCHDCFNDIRNTSGSIPARPRVCITCREYHPPEQYEIVLKNRARCYSCIEKLKPMECLCTVCGASDPSLFSVVGKPHKFHSKTVCKKCRNSQPIDLLSKRVHSANKRSQLKAFEFNLTVDWIKLQYEKQNGLCIYTNKAMDARFKGPYSVSIDRINSDLGYTQDNCQLICSFINRWKFNHTEEEFVELIKVAYEGMFS